MTDERAPERNAMNNDVGNVDPLADVPFASSAAEEYARERNLSTVDFLDVSPSGAENRYVKDDVEKIAARKAAAEEFVSMEEPNDDFSGYTFQTQSNARPLADARADDFRRQGFAATVRENADGMFHVLTKGASSGKEREND